jgi:hypothetical protein
VNWYAAIILYQVGGTSLGIDVTWLQAETLEEAELVAKNRYLNGPQFVSPRRNLDVKVAELPDQGTRWLQLLEEGGLKYELIRSQKHGPHLLNLMPLHTCEECKALFIPYDGSVGWTWEERTKKAGVKIGGGRRHDSLYMCDDCYNKPPEEEQCELCGEMRKRGEIAARRGLRPYQKSFCKPCYNTVPASRWSDAVGHDYDLED